MSSIYIVDRIEGRCAVCETEKKEMVDIELTSIFGIVKEGKVILKREDGYYVDEEATIKRKDEIKKLMEGMWEE
ncbi:hypothetical protein D3C73_1461850 [compost metagenome]